MSNTKIGGKKMDAIEIIKESIYYPLNDTRGWGLIAAIFVVVGILEQLAIQYPDSATVFHFLSFIVSIFLAGVNLSIIKETIDGSSKIPLFDPVKNFIDGVKNIVVEVIYYVIPAILTLIIALIAGVFPKTEAFITSINTTALASTNSASILSTVPQNVTQDLVVSIGIVAIAAFILFVVFALLLIIGQARLADTGDVFAAVNIQEVISKISSIGWGNYIIFIILLLVLIFVVGFVGGLVALIPFVGKIIESIFFGSYILIVIARAVGLIYLEG